MYTKGETVRARSKSDLRLLELARVLVRFNHIACIIVNADHGIM
jgi:hypothetical protein